MKVAFLCAVLLWPTSLWAQTSAEANAQATLGQLLDAARLLKNAEHARDRVRALTATVAAYGCFCAAFFG